MITLLTLLLLPLAFFYRPDIFWISVISGVTIAVAVLAAQAKIDSDQTKDIEYTVFLGRTRVMTTRTRPSGFSIGSRGSIRGYWRFREEVDHIDAEFEVHYRDGRVRSVSAREGSKKCDKLYSYIGKPKPKPVEPPKPMVIEPPKVIEQPKIVEAEKFEIKPQGQEKSKYYIEIPFEIAPNEYGLAISYPSCQVEHTKDGERRACVRFTATYDATVKGLRNRVIVCSLVNESGKTMDVRRNTKTLDTSGCQMIDLHFWQLMDEEPARVIVGIDKYY